MPRLLLRLLLLLLSAAHETPLSVACASLTMLPAPTAVEKASRGLERPLPLLRLLLLPPLSAAHETPLLVACASLAMLPDRHRGGKRRLREAAPAAEAVAAAALGCPRDAPVDRLRELADAARAHRRRGGERGLGEAASAAETAAAAAAVGCPRNAAVCRLRELVDAARPPSRRRAGPLLLLKLPLLPLSAAHATALSGRQRELAMLPAPNAVEEAEEASGDLGRQPLLLRLLPRLLLRLLLLLHLAAQATPLSVACASLAMLPVPTAVEGASGG